MMDESVGQPIDHKLLLRPLLLDFFWPPQERLGEDPPPHHQHKVNQAHLIHHNNPNQEPSSREGSGHDIAEFDARY